MQTVCRASGVYSERPRFSLVHVHPRYQGTPPKVAITVDYRQWYNEVYNRCYEKAYSVHLYPQFSPFSNG